MFVKTVSDPVSLFSHLTVGLGLAKNRQMRAVVSSSDTTLLPDITKPFGETVIFGESKKVTHYNNLALLVVQLLRYKSIHVKFGEPLYPTTHAYSLEELNG